MPEKKPFPIPFIDNLSGYTALHLSLTAGSTENTRVAEYFLQKLLPNMPLDHHGRAIADILPECVERDIRFLAEYMDARFLSTRQLQKVSRADDNLTIKVDPETADNKYYITACDLWPDERFISNQIFEEGNGGSEITVTVLDLPKVHNPNDPIAHKFMEALAGVEETSIFGSKSVKSIVAFRWGPCK